jgi:hypothetical protein
VPKQNPGNSKARRRRYCLPLQVEHRSGESLNSLLQDVIAGKQIRVTEDPAHGYITVDLTQEDPCKERSGLAFAISPLPEKESIGSNSRAPYRSRSRKMFHSIDIASR